MRLKVSQAAKNKHSKMVVDLGWTPANELYSVSDDKTILRHTIDGGEPGKNEKQLEPIDVYATCFHWLAGQNNVAEVFALGCSNGSIRLVSRFGRIEKTLADAHAGAVTAIRWNEDGSGLVSGGEDGHLKHWSRNGNLRSKLATSDRAIYSCCWSPDSQSVLYASGQFICIKPAAAGAKQIKWKAHDSTVLKVDWNPINNLIISGGEDKKYKVWDSFGRPLFTSKTSEFPITAVKWAPNGNYFAVGSFDMIALCDKTGWMHSRESTKSGSILSIDWTSDGTHLAGAGANGAVCFGQIVDRSLEWKNYEITLNENNQVVVTDVNNESTAPDEFEFGGGRVIEMSLAWNHLIVATDKKCYIYMLQNLSTPQVMDLVGGGSVNLILQSERYFLLVDNVRGIQVFTYEGKLVSNPRLATLRAQLLKQGNITLSDDVVAVIDRTNPKLVHLLDATSGKALSEPLKHDLEVVDIALNQTGSVSERKLFFIDRNRDLFITPIIRPSPFKLATMVDTAMWNDSTDILAAVSDSKLTVWYCPAAAFIDKDLINFTRTQTDAAHFGKGSAFISFFDTRLSVRKSDGAIQSASINPAPAFLHRYCLSGQWSKAVRLCRWSPTGAGGGGNNVSILGSATGSAGSAVSASAPIVSGAKDEVLWSTLAVLSIAGQQLDTAEIALSALDEIDKVQFIQYIKTVPSSEGRNAELLLYRRRHDDAESILLQAKLIWRAIQLNVRIFRWQRALDLSIQHRQHFDTVLYYRARYLAGLEQKETDKRFINLAANGPDGKSGPVAVPDSKTITEKEAAEIEKEVARGTPYKPILDSKVVDTKSDSDTGAGGGGFGASSPLNRDSKEDSAPPVSRTATTSKTPAKKGADSKASEGARPAVKKATRIDIAND